MHFSRQIPRALDDEHRASLALLDRLERTLQRGADADWAAFARPLLGLIDNDVTRHFGFEEDELFPRLADARSGTRIRSSRPSATASCTGAVPPT